MSYDDFAKDIQRSPEEFQRLCAKHGFMVVPFEPNEADLQAMRRALPLSGGARSYVREAYAALVDRRRPLEFMPDKPVKAPIIRQD